MTGFVAFVVMLLSAAMGLVQLALGLVSAVMLLCAAFTGIGFLVTHRAHDGINAAGFLFYSAVPFVAIVVLRVYWDKLLTYRSFAAEADGAHWSASAGSRHQPYRLGIDRGWAGD